jgi:hypothetical protein
MREEVSFLESYNQCTQLLKCTHLPRLAFRHDITEPSLALHGLTGQTAIGGRDLAAGRWRSRATTPLFGPLWRILNTLSITRIYIYIVLLYLVKCAPFCITLCTCSDSLRPSFLPPPFAARISDCSHIKAASRLVWGAQPISTLNPQNVSLIPSLRCSRTADY